MQHKRKRVEAEDDVSCPPQTCLFIEKQEECEEMTAFDKS